MITNGNTENQTKAAQKHGIFRVFGKKTGINESGEASPEAHSPFSKRRLALGLILVPGKTEEPSPCLSPCLFSREELISLTLPAVLETFLTLLVGMMDTIMVSSAGENAVSAVSMVDAICVLFIDMFTALGVGGAVVCGHCIGAGNQSRARLASEHLTVLLSTISLASVAVFMLFEQQLLTLLYGSVEPELFENCRIYYHLVIPSIPFIALYKSAAAVFRVSGDSRTPLIITVGVNLINIIGNATLIYGFKMGVAGVAIPTLISRAIGMLAAIALLLRKGFSLNIRDIFRHRIEPALMRNICSVGVPTAIENGMFQFGKLILVSLVSTLTAAEIAANAVGNAVCTLHCVVGGGVNTVVMAVCSRCVGAGKYDQARWYTGYFARFVFISQGVLNLAMALAIPLTTRLYNLSPDTAEIAAKILLLHGVSSVLLWPFSFLYNNTLRAAGDSRFVMLIASVSMWLCRVGLAFLLIKVLHFGVLSVWIAWDVDWFFRISFFIPRYLGDKWEGRAVTG